MTAPAPVFLHVGLRKSGTTYLQHALRGSVAELREQGVELVYGDRDRFVADVVRPLKRYAGGGPVEPALAGAATLQATLEATLSSRGGGRALISLEDLAELPVPAIALLAPALAGREVHVVVTARHWGHTIPSEWQQAVKERSTRSYADFVAAVRARRPAGREFLARQELPEVVRRWAQGLPESRLHVVAVPPSSRVSGSLLDLFGEVVGIDPASLSVPKAPLNESLSLPQAEFLRRVNVELGDRMPRADGVYKEGVRGWLARGSLMAHERSPIRLPADAVEWCVGETRRQLEQVRALEDDGRVRLVGEADDLVADPGLATGPATATEEEVAAVAVRTVADVTALRWSERTAAHEQSSRGRPRPRDGELPVVRQRGGLFRRSR